MVNLLPRLLLLVLLVLLDVHADRHHRGHGDEAGDEPPHGGGGGHHGGGGHRRHGGGGGVQRQPPPNGPRDESPPFAGGCAGGGGCGGGGNWMNGGGGGPAQGVPLFLFPDHAQRAVDLVLRGDSAFHQDNHDLARHLFHLLAHQFPRKWFIVGVGSVARDAEQRVQPRVWAPAGASDTLNGTLSLQVPREYGNFPFFDARRLQQRQNGSRLWYFVHATDAVPNFSNNGGGAERPTSGLAKCLAKRRCVPEGINQLGYLCAADHPRPLGMVAVFGQAAEAAIFASEPLTMDGARMALVSAVKPCEHDADNDDDDAEGGGRLQHVLLVATRKDVEE